MIKRIRQTISITLIFAFVGSSLYVSRAEADGTTAQQSPQGIANMIRPDYSRLIENISNIQGLVAEILEIKSAATLPVFSNIRS